MPAPLVRAMPAGTAIARCSTLTKLAFNAMASAVAELISSTELPGVCPIRAQLLAKRLMPGEPFNLSVTDPSQMATFFLLQEIVAAADCGPCNPTASQIPPAAGR